MFNFLFQFHFVPQKIPVSSDSAAGPTLECDAMGAE
jgi:hypothetical protein